MFAGNAVGLIGAMCDESCCNRDLGEEELVAVDGAGMASVGVLIDRQARMMLTASAALDRERAMEGDWPVEGTGTKGGAG